VLQCEAIRANLLFMISSINSRRRQPRQLLVAIDPDLEAWATSGVAVGSKASISA
jgi:hypothetical protein